MTWRTVLHRVVLGLLVPLVGVLLALALLLGRLAQGPLDVTGLSHRWGEAFAHPEGGTLSWRRAALAWQPRHQAHPAELLVQLDDVRFRPPHGPAGAENGGGGQDCVQALDRAGILFNLTALLRGEVMVRSLDASGLHLALAKGRQGQFRLAGLPDRPGASRPGGWSFLPRPALVMQLRHVGLHDVRLSVHDDASPAAALGVQVPLLQADYRAKTGWQGQLVAALQGVDPAIVRLTGSIGPAGPQDSHWQLALSPVRPAALAAWLPLPPGQKQLAAGADLPLSLQLEGQVHGREMAGRLEGMSGHLLAGAGQVLRPGKAPLHLASAWSAFTLGAEPVLAGQAPQRALAVQARLMLRDSRGQVVPLSLNSHGTLDSLLHPRHMALMLEGDAPAFDFATLASIWPEGAARGARRWMTTNMTAGQGEGLRIETHLHSDSGPDGLLVDQLSGELTGHKLSVTWLAGLPQVTGVEAHARFLDPDHLQIDVRQGHLSDGRGGSLGLPAGRIILAGLLQEGQTGQFSLGMKGALPSFLALLSRPQLNLLSRHPVGFSDAAGALEGTLSLSLPLNLHVRMKDIAFGAEFEARQVGLVLSSLGRVRRGWGHLSVADAGLTIKGGAQLRGLDVRGSVFDSFQPNRAGALLLKADLQAPLGAAELRRLGAPASMAQAPLLRGQGQAHVIYSQYGRGGGHNRSTALVQTDFTPMAFTAPYWRKPAGVAAGLRASLGWEDGRLARLDDVQAYGPMLGLQARARMRDGQMAGLELSRLQLGRTEGSATLDWPLRGGGDAGQYRFALQAGTLDMTPWWGRTIPASYGSHADGRAVSQPFASASSGRAGVKDSREGGPRLVEHGHAPLLPAGRWEVGLHADRVIYGDEQHAGNVTAHARWAGQKLAAASLRIGQPDRVEFDLTPVAGKPGALDVRLDIADAGALFASLGLYKQFSGGVLALHGRCQPAVDAGKEAGERGPGLGFGLGLPPFRGTLRVDHMALEHPPTPLVVATLAAPLHWGQISRQRFENVRLRAALHLADNRLDVEDGRASNDILGGTLRGRMDFSRATLAMQGTLSPFFGVNHAAGTMFGEKTVMAPEKGSGVMAITYTLEGSFAKPALHVNPFSAFLPGALRNLFD